MERPYRASWIPHLIGPGDVTDCFRCHSGAPCWGWIPAFAGMTEVGAFEPVDCGTMFCTIPAPPGLPCLRGHIGEDTVSPITTTWSGMVG